MSKMFCLHIQILEPMLLLLIQLIQIQDQLFIFIAYNFLNIVRFAIFFFMKCSLLHKLGKTIPNTRKFSFYLFTYLLYLIYLLFLNIYDKLFIINYKIIN
jgi:hypothetical protein